MTPKPFPAFVLLLSWPPWPTRSVKTRRPDLSEGDETWEMERRKKKRTQEKKRGCATSNSEYLRVKCALQFFPLAGPWECNALARCLGKCVPYVWALYPSALSSPERGATGQGARERCLWLKSFFPHWHIWSGREKERKRERQRWGGAKQKSHGSVVEPECGRSRNSPPPPTTSTTTTIKYLWNIPTGF